MLGSPRRLAGLLLAAAASLAAASPARASSLREQARAGLLKGDYASAVDSYTPTAATSGDPALAAEYGYALAAAGLAEPSLAQLDRALLLDSKNEAARYFASQILSSLGLADAAAEIAKPAPAWLKDAKIPLTGLQHERKVGDFKKELSAANVLMLQRRYVSAADRFHRLTEVYPKERLAWAGYSIALENLGAYKAAAKAVAQDVALRASSADAKALQLAQNHQKELESRPPFSTEQPKKAADTLKGRYLAFFGGNFTHTSGQSLTNLNGRLGKFLTNRIDVGANAGWITGNSNHDLNGLTAGISGRYNTPIVNDFPLNLTAAARVEYDPAPSDNLALILSPGLSHFTQSGSIDLYLDYALTGPIKHSATLSLGYTAYFGGGK